MNERPDLKQIRHDYVDPGFYDDGNSDIGKTFGPVLDYTEALELRIGQLEDDLTVMTLERDGFADMASKLSDIRYKLIEMLNEQRDKAVR